MHSAAILKVLETMGEWLVSCAIRLINQCSCGPIYGAYREALFDAATNRELTEHSIILIRPRYALFGLKFGVKIGGLCRNRNGAEVRDFFEVKKHLAVNEAVAVVVLVQIPSGDVAGIGRLPIS